MPDPLLDELLAIWSRLKAVPDRERIVDIARLVADAGEARQVHVHGLEKRTQG